MRRRPIKTACKQGYVPKKQTVPYQKEGRRNMMKRRWLWVLGAGVLATVGVVTAERGFAIENDGPKCTPATLKGRYLFASTGTLFPPAFGLTETAVGSAAGVHIFDGNGGGQDYVTFTI